MPDIQFVKEHVETDRFGFVLTGHDVTHGDGTHAHRAGPLERSVAPVNRASSLKLRRLSMLLRSIADRRDVRPTVVVYANGDWEGVAKRPIRLLPSHHVAQRPGWRL